MDRDEILLYLPELRSTGRMSVRWFPATLVRPRPRRTVTGALWRTRAGIVASAVVMLVGFGIGFLTHEPATATSAGPGPFSFDDPTWLTLAANNLIVATTLVAGGMTLGAVSLSVLLYNGFLVGIVVKTLLSQGVPAHRIAAAVAPHGLLEIPALLLAGGVGLYYAGTLWQYILERRDTPVTKAEIVDGLWLFAIAAGGIVVAAVIEVHVTPRLV